MDVRTAERVVSESTLRQRSSRTLPRQSPRSDPSLGPRYGGAFLYVIYTLLTSGRIEVPAGVLRCFSADAVVP